MYNIFVIKILVWFSKPLYLFQLFILLINVYLNDLYN